MAKLSKVKHELMLKQWSGLLDNFASSGLTVAQWCAYNNTTRHQFYYWQKRVREKALDQLPEDIKNELISADESTPVAFKKLEVASPVPGYQPAVVIRLNNATLEIQDGASQSTVEAVLLALKNIC